MPELPEVETVRRSLLDHLPGRAVLDVEVRDPYVLRGQPIAEFTQALQGKTFQTLERHGKLLYFPLQGGSMIVHLGMTGQLTVQGRKPALEQASQPVPDKHTHIRITLEGDLALHYRDVRKFGRVYIIPETSKEAVVARFVLGVDPLSDSFSRATLASGLKHRRTAVKAALLDQKFLAGLGNIYVDEALFVAGIRPGRAAYRVRGAQLDRLAAAIPSVLSKGLAAGGTTLRDFISGTGEAGYNQEGLLVYGRYGKPCVVCGETIRRGEFAGRTSSWCARCQS